MNHWLINGDSEKVLKKIRDNSLHLAITSPPYFNAREYSQWETLESYLHDMKKIFKEVYRVLDNHRIFVLNVGDIQCKLGKQPWTQRRIPLGAYFTTICQEIGFEFVDDYIWDKGEPQSYRHINGGNEYPFYIYPVNVYEHILVFHKHERDLTRLPCPVCGSIKVQNNSQSEIGVQSWECNNEECTERSAGNRGKRYSARSVMMQAGKTHNNLIDKKLINKWRRDIARFSPAIKWIKGKNRLGHTAPFPEDIPEMAINFFSYEGDTVLDMFAGSFTTNVVAEKYGRNSVGIELSKEYFTLGSERLTGVLKEEHDSQIKKITKEELSKINKIELIPSKYWNKLSYIKQKTEVKNRKTNKKEDNSKLKQTTSV